MLENFSIEAWVFVPPLIAHAPLLGRAALSPNLDHSCKCLNTWLQNAHHMHLLLLTHIWPKIKHVDHSAVGRFSTQTKYQQMYSIMVLISVKHANIVELTE